MKYIKLIVLSILVSIFVVSCTKYSTKGELFPQVYEYHPLSILVLPPINETTAADAKEYYSTTIAEPLTLTGYYVYPIEVISDILKSEGLYDTELLLSTPPQKFKEYFGADAVMYIRILNWDTAYYVIGGHVTVSVDFLMKSTESGETIWRYKGKIIVDTSVSSNSGFLLADLIVNVVATAIVTATQDYVPVAKQANYITLQALPYGKYHSLHDKDKKDKVVIQKNKSDKK